MVSEQPDQPEQPRLPGRSRAYTLPTLPQRLRQWHAPRINRWEKLWVTGDSLAIECLGATGATSIELHEGEHGWFAPYTAGG
jgi:hypothetical protein